MLVDVHRHRPRAYLHCHKLHPKFKEPGWTKSGPCEVRMIVEMIEPLVIGNKSDGRRQIFWEKPHMTWDNFFLVIESWNIVVVRVLV